MTDQPTPRGFKKFTTGFWALSRPKQEAFLKGLYDLSPENKDLFKLWITQDKAGVMQDLKKEIQKETTQRIPRFRKLRLAKLNLILRNAHKYALPMAQQTELRREVWMGMLAFILAKPRLPERYQVACARHLDEYLTMVKHHVLEPSEVEDVLAKDKALLEKAFQKGIYLPHVEDVYVQHFV